jgi:hypothetical protein
LPGLNKTKERNKSLFRHDVAGWRRERLHVLPSDSETITIFELMDDGYKIALDARIDFVGRLPPFGSVELQVCEFFDRIFK